MRRSVCVMGFIVFISALCSIGLNVNAETYPSRPIQLIIPIPAGGGGDVNGRILAEELGKILGQQIIVHLSGPALLGGELHSRVD